MVANLMIPWIAIINIKAQIVFQGKKIATAL
jgi:hypothetical protein